jgi:hypothetical protein
VPTCAVYTDPLFTQERQRQVALELAQQVEQDRARKEQAKAAAAAEERRENDRIEQQRAQLAKQ